MKRRGIALGNRDLQGVAGSPYIGCEYWPTVTINTQLALFGDTFDFAVVVGNPVMHHLFLGWDPRELGRAPFTLASYAIEGGGSRNYLHTKQMMYSDPASWHKLMDKFARVITGYLRRQIKAGAQAIQLFDSWVGCLSIGDYEEYVMPHVQLIFDGLKREGVPMIHFGTGTTAIVLIFDAHHADRAAIVTWPGRQRSSPPSCRRRRAP